MPETPAHSRGQPKCLPLAAGVDPDDRLPEALPLSAVPRGRRSRHPWVVKLVAEAGTGRVRGAHAVPDGAGEMITASYAIRAGMTVTDLAKA
jgi:mercuric reductase